MDLAQVLQHRWVGGGGEGLRSLALTRPAQVPSHNFDAMQLFWSRAFAQRVSKHYSYAFFSRMKTCQGWDRVGGGFGAPLALWSRIRPLRAWIGP